MRGVAKSAYGRVSSALTTKHNNSIRASYLEALVLQNELKELNSTTACRLVQVEVKEGTRRDL